VANNDDNTVTVITVDYAPEITSGPPLAAPVGSPFSHVVTADAFPAATFAVTAGALPTGLTLNAATGAISGTPTASGTFNFTVTATNTSGTDSQPHSLLITLGLAATGGDVTINPGSQS